MLALPYQLFVAVQRSIEPGHSTVANLSCPVHKRPFRVGSKNVGFETMAKASRNGKQSTYGWQHLLAWPI